MADVTDTNTIARTEPQSFSSSQQLSTAQQLSEAIYNQAVIVFQRIADGKERICDLGIQFLVGKFRNADIDHFVEILFERESPVKMQMLEYFFSNEYFVSCPLLRSSGEYVARYYKATGDPRAVQVFADLLRDTDCAEYRLMLQK